jgi:hypothetical protein
MGVMRTRPITVAETRVFMRTAEKIWSEDELAGLVDYLARNPETGDVIPGTGGVRKLRWGRAGGGKRGGARAVYFYYSPDCPVYLLLAYAKAQATDLTPAERKAVTALAATIKAAASHTKGQK